MLIYLETNRWGLGRPAIPKGHIYTTTWRGGCSGSGRKGLGQIGKDPKRRPFGPLSCASGTHCDSYPPLPQQSVPDRAKPKIE
jgi:hypothetical protein